MHPWDQAKFGDRREAITAYRKILAEAKKAKAEQQITAVALPEGETTATDQIMAMAVPMDAV